MSIAVKVMKYQIVCPVNVEWKVFETYLRTLAYQSRTIGNRTIQKIWEFDNLSLNHFKETGEYPSAQQLYGCTQKTISGYIYDQLKEEYQDINKANMSTTIQKTLKNWNSRRKEIWRGERKQNSMKVILDRIIDSTYAKGACMLHKHKKKWYLSITYKSNIKEELKFDEDLIMGIDMGKINVLYFAFNKGLVRGAISGEEIEAFRKKIEHRRISLLRQGKYCSGNRIGKGREKRIKPIDVLNDKVAKFRNATNHKYANYIVQQCLKYNCGTIQLEDLKGISKEQTFLKNWTYFDLQEKIKNQANQYEVKVVKIDPFYTSQRCSECGYIHKNNRQDQSTFECQQCSFKVHADYNAAKNISVYNIEKVIQKQLELQEKLNLTKYKERYIEQMENIN
ncbi:transposase [Bacillus cereus group sp. BfR-BA-01119]|nr:MULTISPECIES: RNA-guided endonuclease TnpB family protein [Bacillus cereus group]ACI30327.1 putative transposase DNA-binding domain family [Bacillus cereus H3081.97]EJP87478.1 IS605 OrfB family transposase [Bacillus cereus IS075]EJP98863.1 IS605 OrfB family transposase [Bacillus cereus AND1407]EOO83043.1 IS605 OrfB family transposase [Bacillus cereus IS845/00]EOO92758.1 IS605 OrfB family transposase [Bacillus cereus IS195]KXI71511.1 transposase [Bacillus cereus]